MKQVCIYPKNIMKHLGCSKRKAYKLLSDIRLALGKEKHQYVTVKEFCAYTGIDEDSIEL